MADVHKPIEKIRGKAAGIAYTGIATNWKFSFGNVIVIAENYEALAIACQRIEERKDLQVSDPELCKQVAVFQMSDVEVA